MERSLIPTLPCMCGNLRRTSRALTQLYENALGLTTLTRTLQIMVRGGWIAERRGEDRRERRLRLAKAGEAQLNRALPVWGKVQSRLRRQLGEQAWKNLLDRSSVLRKAVIR